MATEPTEDSPRVLPPEISKVDIAGDQFLSCSLRFPHTVIPPRRDVEGLLLRLRSSDKGVPALKMQGKDAVPKNLFVDSTGNMLFYTPSTKPLVGRSFFFRDFSDLALLCAADGKTQWEPPASAGATTLAPVDSTVALTATGGPKTVAALTRDTPVDRHVVLLVRVRGAAKKELRLTVHADDALALAHALARYVRAAHNDLDDPHFASLFSAWQMGDMDANNRITVEELHALLGRLNVVRTRAEVQQLFRSYDIDGDGELTFEEFAALFLSISSVATVRPLFDHFLAPGADEWSEEQICAFFLQAQGERLSADGARAMIRGYARTASERTKARFDALKSASGGATSSLAPLSTTLSFHSFCTWLVDPRRNGWFNPRHDSVRVADMRHPLRDYFIASSFNTYLTGSQFTSSSRAEMYGRALLRGCRAIEIDIHDGPKGPLVFNRLSLTSQVPLRDVLVAVRDAAFIASPYPVILTLDVHAGGANARLAAQAIQELLGGWVLLPGEVDEAGFTPHGLRNRIIVHWLRPEEARRRAKTPADADGLAELAAFTTLFNRTDADVQLVLQEERLGKPIDDARKVNFRSLLQFNEETLPDVAGGDEAARAQRKEFLLAVTRRSLARVEPMNTRAALSSNQDALAAWGAGVQMVAMSYQTYDENRAIHDGMFRQQGACGYVLKPHWMRDPAGAAAAAHAPKRLQLTVQVLCGFQLPAVGGIAARPLIEVQLAEPQLPEAGGSPAAAAVAAAAPEGSPRGAMIDATTYRTAPAHVNGFSPEWNEVVSFVVHDPDLAVLVVNVVSASLDGRGPVSKTLAVGAAPISSLQLGYRAVALRSLEGDFMRSSSVLCHFSLKAI